MHAVLTGVLRLNCRQGGEKSGSAQRLPAFRPGGDEKLAG